MEKIDDSLTKISSIMEELSLLDGKKNYCEAIIELQPQVNKIQKELQKLDSTQESIFGITGILNELTRNSERLSEADERIESKKKELIELLLSAKVCPICGTETSKEDIEKHVENII